jgi:hypothetical protein
MVLFIKLVKKNLRALKKDLSDYTDCEMITQIKSLLKIGIISFSNLCNLLLKSA